MREEPSAIFNPDATITIDDVHGLKCLLIDDVFSDPDGLRRCAKDSLQPENITNLRLGYEIHPPGIDDHLPNYSDELAGMIHQHIGANVCAFFGIDESAVSLQAYKGPYFNCVGVAQLPSFAPHVDAGHISTFAYLCLPENCAGGTRIFRHLPTDKIHIVNHQDNSLAGMIQVPLDSPLVESTEEWEVVEFFEMKYNRLIAFNSSAIHKIDLTGGNFSMEFEETRLTLNCFFHYLDGHGNPASRTPAL